MRERLSEYEYGGAAKGCAGPSSALSDTGWSESDFWPGQTRAAASVLTHTTSVPFQTLPVMGKGTE